MEQYETLLSRLEAYAKDDVVGFHMPGHKRNADLAPYLEKLGARWDITEIPGFDDLHDAQGILKESMERCAGLCRAKEAFFLINGSTGGLLSAIRAATNWGDKILVGRNCHKAVYHAIELCGLEAVYLQGPVVEGFGCVGSITPEMAKKALEAHADVKLMMLTSPTYEGILSDIAGISEICHSKGIPVVVDAAHGAHLGMAEGFPQSALDLGADVVVESFHKTLPSLTQTAILLYSSERISLVELKRQLGIFQSSSPSYLLMASLDACVTLLLEEKERLFSAWGERLGLFQEKMKSLKHFEILSQREGIFALEPSKIVISTGKSGFSGKNLMKVLEKDFGVQLEMALEHYAIAMTSIADTDEAMDKLARGLLAVDASREGCGEEISYDVLPIPKASMPLYMGVREKWGLISLENSLGKVCGESIWAYPPGIPLILPGEEISTETLSRVEKLLETGVHMVSTRGELPLSIAVLE